MKTMIDPLGSSPPTCGIPAKNFEIISTLPAGLCAAFLAPVIGDSNLSVGVTD